MRLNRVMVLSHQMWALGVMVFVTSLLLTPGCSAQETTSEKELESYDHSYESYGRMLSEHVQNGLVDYAGIKTNRHRLDSLVNRIATADLAGATVELRIAFYCNAYNILTIRSIVDAYPVASIKDISGVWDKQDWVVAGTKLTLNEIEHEVLRKEFAEPRIHVAINCASIGCPPLLEVPYLPDRLDSLLTTSARRFANSRTHNQIDLQHRTAGLSAIFNWFGDDFIARYYDGDRFPGMNKKEASALTFVLGHHAVNSSIESGVTDFTVEYLEYDWALNDLRR